jgi:hypothetical protein
MIRQSVLELSLCWDIDIMDAMNRLIRQYGYPFDPVKRR